MSYPHPQPQSATYYTPPKNASTTSNKKPCGCGGKKTK